MSVRGPPAGYRVKSYRPVTPGMGVSRVAIGTSLTCPGEVSRYISSAFPSGTLGQDTSTPIGEIEVSR
jgi:hypothetical protein